jgi:hypothetical protein
LAEGVGGNREVFRVKDRDKCFRIINQANQIDLGDHGKAMKETRANAHSTRLIFFYKFRVNVHNGIDERCCTLMFIDVPGSEDAGARLSDENLSDDVREAAEINLM